MHQICSSFSIMTLVVVPLLKVKDRTEWLFILMGLAEFKVNAKYSHIISLRNSLYVVDRVDGPYAVFLRFEKRLKNGVWVCSQRCACWWPSAVRCCADRLGYGLFMGQVLWKVYYVSWISWKISNSCCITQACSIYSRSGLMMHCVNWPLGQTNTP